MHNKKFCLPILIFGLLTALAPRYILPVCGFAGLEHMVCDRLYYAGIVLGISTAVISVIGMLVPSAFRFLMIVSFILGVMVVFSPDVLGYCKSPSMPCHYGTLPMTRILGIMIAGVSAPAFVFAARRKKETR